MPSNLRLRSVGVMGWAANAAAVAMSLRETPARATEAKSV